MGNFSRDPGVRLLDAEAKHYIGHRIQQGVPVLDADFHLIDGLRRREVESIGQWMLGDGVPVGSDAFRVTALGGGGVNTVVLKSKTIGTGPSSIVVDLTASTAAAALGFDATNASSSRTGNSSAQITSRIAQPFVLTAGTTLTLIADGGASETVTFVAADFANIAAATAAEVSAKINAVATRVSAGAGAGNDLTLAGGNGTTVGAGRLLMEGRLVLIERGLRYSEQPLYQNAALATIWGVTPVGPIPTPTVAEAQTVFVDVWDREVGGAEDPALVDSRIGIETAVSLRREWAVRVVRASDYAAALAARPAGHAYYPIATLKRGANNPRILPEMVVDIRDTDQSLRPEIAYRTGTGIVVVDTARFRNMLTLTRDGARDFITYLTTKFVAPSANYLAAEIAGIEALSAIANAADHALGAIFARSLGTRGALGVMQQLYDAEKRFVTTWQSVVLPLVKGGQPVYQTAFGNSITVIKNCLDGPPPAGLTAMTAALAASNLEGATASQERIGNELAALSGQTLGTLSLKYLGSTSATVLRNTPLDLRFEVTGDITPDDDLLVQTFLDPAWSVSLKNGDGSTPFTLHAGPGAFTRQFLVTVTPPDVPAAQTNFSVEIHARKNPAGVMAPTGQKSLQIGSAPPASEAQYQIKVLTVAALVAGVYQVNHGTAVNVFFRVTNNTGTAISVDLEATPAAAGWGVADSGAALVGVGIPPLSFKEFQWRFTAPVTVGPQLTFTLRAKDHTNLPTVLADVTIVLESK